MDGNRLVEKVCDITDQLERNATIKLNKEKAYYEGYLRACEEFSAAMRQEIICEVNRL